MAQVSTVVCDNASVLAICVQDSDNKDGFILSSITNRTGDYYEVMGHCVIAYTPKWGKVMPSTSHLIIF